MTACPSFSRRALAGIQATMLLFLLAAAACSAFRRPDPKWIQDFYRDKIMEWQKRIQNEGWTEKLVDDVANQCLHLARYKEEKVDYWDTPREFIESGFTGDCEDIAIFMMATFKRLVYPRASRVLIVHTLRGDHAVFKIELGPGKWRVYESVTAPLVEIDQLFYRPILEFDEQRIYYLQ